MPLHTHLHLDLWRETCRHVELGESAAHALQVLRRHLPVGLLLIRVVDPERGCVETVARTGAPNGATATRTPCAGDDLDRLLRWCRLGQVARATAASAGQFAPAALPPGLEGEVLLGPLSTGHGPPGVLALISDNHTEGSQFTTAHAQTMAALLEPFAVALENYRRLRELQTLRSAAEAETRSLRSRLGRDSPAEPIIGAETGLRHVIHRVDLVAGSDVPVLILGETGSGKEVVARAIHNRSRRAAGPFLRVNCGAIPPDIVDSQLFGHERGSFTGAVKERAGWFERADGGTLFLDECGELPPAVQVRLLRILQDGTFERVGGEAPLQVDVRIVAATHRDLRAMTAEGRFREDLWYRLAVFPVHLPALRDRREDLPALANHFALRAANRFGLPPQLPTPEDLELLVAYPWPGNVRELASVIERAAILGDGHRLDVAASLGVHPPHLAGVAVPSQEPLTPFRTLDEAIVVHIEAALRRTQGRIEGPQGAAAILAINPHTLRSRMRKLRLDWRAFRS